MNFDLYKPCGDVEHLLGRRQFMGDLLAGAGILAGTSLLASPVGAAEIAKRSKSVVVLYLYGGISQFESWDPKSHHETGGPFQAIPTSVPGVHISELLPHTAKQMHRMALIRSLNTKQDSHTEASFLLRSGRAIDHAMIEGQAQGECVADRELAATHDWFFHDPPDAEDASLRQVEDRNAQGPESWRGLSVTRWRAPDRRGSREP